MLTSIFSSSPVSHTSSTFDYKQWQPLGPTKEITLGNVLINCSTQFSSDFKNESDEQIAISRLSATCGCTELNAHPRIVNPGEKGIIRGTFSPKSRPGVFQVRADGTVTGLSSGARGAVSLLLTAEVVSGISIDKTKLVLEPAFGKVKADGVSKITVRNLLSSAQEILVSELAGPVSIQPRAFRLSPGETQELVITARAEQQQSQHKALVTTGKGESYPIDILVRPKLPVTISPEKLVLGVVSRTEDGLLASSNLSITLKGNINSSDIHVKELPEPLQECTTLNNNDGLKLTFGMAKSFSGKLVRGDIVLMIDTAEMPMTEIRIPVIGVFRDKMELLP